MRRETNILTAVVGMVVLTVATGVILTVESASSVIQGLAIYAVGLAIVAVSVFSEVVRRTREKLIGEKK